ncbi:MAG: FAD-dependent oxidoreductase [Desulfobulbaceae bacterium]|nr:FAD-dependent oxidoreductase [Desulfobulbaceae bacterium]
MTNKNLVLIGGGHAHMEVLANLKLFKEKGFEVTVIGPSEYHYYSGMGPGMLGMTYTPDDIRFATRHVVEKQGGRFVLDSVRRIAPLTRELQLASGNTLPYDVLSCNAGSYVPKTNVSQSDADIYSVKPIETLLAAQKRLIELLSEKKITVGIIGGGPSSAEIAGNIWQLAHKKNLHMPRIKIFSGRRFMQRFPEKIQKLALHFLKERGIEVSEDDYVKEIKAKSIVMDSGHKHDLDFIFLALGVKPSPIFSESGLPTGPDGGLLVNQFLQCTEHPEIFGGGDCIYFQDHPLNKVGVYAVRQNPILLHNLMASLEGKALWPFDPGGDYLLIFNMGGGEGILNKSWLTFGGKTAFFIKDYIDRKFMRKYQAIE